MPAKGGPDDPVERSPRQHVLLGAEISGFDRKAPTKHRIKDLSVTGARVDRAGMLKPGSTVLVSVGILEAVGATVIWVKDGLAGLRFAEPIDPEAARSKTIVPSAGRIDRDRKSPGTDEQRAGAGWIAGMRDRYRP